MALLLTFAAGCVNIVGYLAVYPMFTAHVTRDTAHLARDLLVARWPGALAAGAAVAAVDTARSDCRSSCATCH
jgi:uncharacterized membrane protein YoaK (UPF0700 family)